MKTYTIAELTQIALKYDTRAAWSINEPESYDYALLNLVQEQDETEFLKITDHMAFNEGRVLSGDPNDPRMLYLRRQLNLTNKKLETHTEDDDKRQDLEIKRNRLNRQIKRRGPC